MIRVGRCKYQNGKRIDPSYKGFEPIVVLTKSSKYGSIGPYVLKDNKGRIMENLWQFSKVYEEVPASKQYYSRYDNTVIWNWPAEKHFDKDKYTDEYIAWRTEGMNAEYPIRYPVGMKHRHKCLFSLSVRKGKEKRLNYIEARKEIYLYLYSKLVKRQKQFQQLKEKLEKGKKLLIIEVDGPHEESLGYYKEKYNVKDNFIENDTILVNKKNMNIMLNDEKHSFGHGYCLAITLLDIEI